jgi:hypothetical protein
MTQEQLLPHTTTPGSADGVGLITMKMVPLSEATPIVVTPRNVPRNIAESSIVEGSGVFRVN